MGKKNPDENVLVAMSGGVDSSVTALLLQKAGYHVKGAILRMHDADMSPEDLINGKLPQSIWYAREAARRLRLDFSILDVRGAFREEVEQYFVSCYEQGLTPNPCIYCNRHMKLPQMFLAAEELGCGRVATGHYAVITRNEETGRYGIRKAADRSKDQSYMLYRLTQEQLSRLLFPLGTYEKSEIREMAAQAGLKNAKAPDSQDICFIPDGDYGRFVRERLLAAAGPDADPERIPGLIPGNFVDREGHVLGRHKGMIYYTIGQRKGLGLSLERPLYVCSKRTDTNEVVLCPDEELYTDRVRAADVHFCSLERFPEGGMHLSAKIRYSLHEAQGQAVMLPDGTLEMTFDTPVRAATPGQSMVLYDGDTLVAGGIIVA